jgi:hypothetical protein
MKKLVGELEEKMTEEKALNEEIKNDLESIGYGR